MIQIDYASLKHCYINLPLLLGLVLLFGGGEWLCKGGSALALRLKISPIVIGLTIVSIATSMPELVTSFYGAMQGSYDLAIGNIVGSNIANIGLILGITALVFPISVHSRLIRTEAPLVMGITFIFMAMSWNGLISQLEGILLLLITVGYLVFTVQSVRKERKAVTTEITESIDVQQHGFFYCLFYIAIGALALQFGAELLIKSSVEIATRLGISEVLIGVTIVAVSTSLPELAASVMAAMRGHFDICAGNVIGSNLFNIIFIAGGVSILYPLEVDRSMLKIEYPTMIIFTGVASWLFVSQKKVTRIKGAILVSFYAIFLVVSAWFQFH